MKVISGIYKGVTTIELDNLAAEIAASLSINHPDYAVLAARLAVSNLHKQTKRLFSEVIDDMYNYSDSVTGKAKPMISDETHAVVMKHAEVNFI